MVEEPPIDVLAAPMYKIEKVSDSVYQLYRNQSAKPLTNQRWTFVQRGESEDELINLIRVLAAGPKYYDKNGDLIS